MSLEDVKNQIRQERPFIGGGMASQAQYEAGIEAEATKRMTNNQPVVRKGRETPSE